MKKISKWLEELNKKIKIKTYQKKQFRENLKQAKEYNEKFNKRMKKSQSSLIRY
jgi:outer membrane murein-binding lipoprotein Lpp